MKFLTALLVSLVTGLATGLIPARFRRQDSHPLLGKCTLKDTEDIFTDYPTECSTAFDSLDEAIRTSSQDETVYREIYGQLCTSDCTDQLKTFADTCETYHYTDQLLHSCEQNLDSGDVCIIAFLKNRGTQAAMDCYTAESTSQCSEACSASLEQLKTDLGCCVNELFNTTTFGLDQMNIASHKLWEQCEVSELTLCDGSLPGQLTGSGAGLAISLSLTSFLIFIQALINHVY